MSRIQILHTGTNYSLGANEDYFHILSNCCADVPFWASLGEFTNAVCSSCGAPLSDAPDQSTLFAVCIARGDPEEFRGWTDAWFPGMEVTFDE